MGLSQASELVAMVAMKKVVLLEHIGVSLRIRTKECTCRMAGCAALSEPAQSHQSMIYHLRWYWSCIHEICC